MDQLEQRSQTILNTIIAEYIATGEPVGSRTVSKMKDIDLSAASIRNIMGDLTDQGYITQPHVSAGRVPTDRGYRFYVDSLVASGWSPSNDDHFAIESLIRTAGIDVRDIMRQSSSVLADLSRKAGVVTASGAGDQRFKTIEFIKVANDRILVVLVSNRGFVQNKVIYDEDGIDQETLERYSRRLSDMLKDLDLREARERIERELDREKTRVDALLAKALRLGQVILSQEAVGEIFIEGQTNIVDEPEFLKIERLKALLVTFEEKSKLLKILDKTLEAKGIQVFIGSEHGLDEIETCSIVAFPIRAQEDELSPGGFSRGYHRPRSISSA
ncbi:MAG: heat-inducible transcriptional repressor HrcA [Deltaproteobacteria bacterium]